jgi:prepilin-type N-terminal cleavage/methylation domain-containing protein
MNVQSTNKKKGFTIIEVVLVLAIAGLIFLMVFIALPALQRSQRDTQRRNDLSRAQTAINSYKSNNRNTVPTDVIEYQTKIRTNYLSAQGDKFEDPSRGDYKFVGGMGNDSYPTYSDSSADILVELGKKCEGENVVPAGDRSVALRMALEGGGTACVSV